jgi:hypothetical protein
MRMEPTGYRVPGRSLSHGRSRALTNCCERLIGRNFSAGFIDVVHVSYTLPVTYYVQPSRQVSWCWWLAGT